MTETQARSKLVTTAKKYLGYNEADGTHKTIIDLYNTQSSLPRGYAVQYDDDWCATYVTAIALEAGMLGIITPECSCYYMMVGFQNKGRWKDKSYSPKTGDFIIYDWEGGSGDPDHVGIVVSNDGTTIRVIEGNKNQSVEYRDITSSYGYIKGYCLPDFASLADTSDAKKIWDYFVDKIGNEYGVAGLMGNLEAESNLCSYRVQGDFSTGYSTSKTYTANVDNGTISKSQFINNGPGGGGYGLAQWTFYTRKQALYEKWQSGGYSSIGSLDLALDYLWHELQTDYAGVLSVLKSATSVRTASDKVLHDFENPADQSTTVEVKRASMGQAWYDKYHGSAPGGGYDRPEWVPRDRKPLSLLLLVSASRRRL